MTYGPAQTVLELAREAGVLLATAESCTGGLIGGALTEVAGSSDVFDRGFITYSNSAKMQMLGVKADTLRQFGAVSEQVAQEMALGALRHSRAGLTVAVTGIAGPGASDHKPEGRVCFGIASAAGVWTETQEFGALGRENVRRATVEHVLGLLEAHLTKDS